MWRRSSGQRAERMRGVGWREVVMRGRRVEWSGGGGGWWWFGWKERVSERKERKVRGRDSCFPVESRRADVISSRPGFYILDEVPVRPREVRRVSRERGERRRLLEGGEMATSKIGRVEFGET